MQNYLVHKMRIIFKLNILVRNSMPESANEEEEKLNFAKYYCTVFLKNFFEQLFLSFS